eukprot:COSAG02_NODE_477_length_21523_cov_11.763163_29_plen_47_part_00
MKASAAGPSQPLQVDPKYHPEKRITELGSSGPPFIMADKPGGMSTT